MQAEIPNHRKLLSVKSRGGERCGKGPPSAGQVCDEKTNVSEPLLTHRKGERWHRNRGSRIVPGTKARPSGRALSQEAACVLAWRCPVYRWRELVAGAGMEQENLSSRYRRPVEMGDVGPLVGEREDPKRQKPRGAEYRCEAQGRTGS